MSLRTALYQVGKMSNESKKTSLKEDCRDIFSYTEIMSPPPKYEIRVWLNSSDPYANILEITGIEKIDCVEYFSGGEGDDDKRLRYLFRDVKGNAKWRYSTIHKLGKGTSHEKASEMFSGESMGDKSHVKLLKDRILNDMEREKVFTQGTADKIEALLTDRTDEIADLINDKKSSYVLILSVYDKEEFLYPAQVPSFLKYFKNKVQILAGEAADGKKYEGVCTQCGKKTTNLTRIDTVTKMATLDKRNFVPGISSSDESKLKVCPICSDCQKHLLEGQMVMLHKYTDSKTITGVNISVVPETVLGTSGFDSVVSAAGKEYLTVGLGKEPFISKFITEMGDDIILNFFFWEKNQSQIKILFTAEDVPPSRLQTISQLWEECEKRYGLNSDLNTSKNGLNRAFGTIFRMMKYTEGFIKKEENDSRGSVRFKCTLNTILDIYKRILSCEQTDIEAVVKYFAEALARAVYNKEMCEHADWDCRRMNCVIDFIYAVNKFYRQQNS